MKSKTAVDLTKGMVDAFEYKGNVTTSAEGRRIEPRCVLWAREPKGLGLRVYPSGRKVWVFAYETEGRKRLMQLGGYPALTLDKAEKAARAHGGKIATAEALGAAAVDPLAEKMERKSGKTVSDLIDAFLGQHAEAKKRPSTAKEYRRQLEKHVLPKWGPRLAKSIKRAEVAALHSKLGETTPYQANRILAALSKMFNFGRIKGFLPDDAPNPCQGIERFEERKRDRWVREGELPRLIEAVNAESNLYARAGIWLFLLTGARKTELLKAKWADVDEDRGELRLPEENTKSGRVHYVPLGEAVRAVLAGIPRQEGNPYILAGAKEGQHLVNIDKPWRRIRKAAGIEDVRIHDLRRTVGSWLATSGESLPLIGKVLNHADVKTTAIYARLAEDPARRAMEEHGKRIMEAAKPLRVVSGGERDGTDGPHRGVLLSYRSVRRTGLAGE